MSTTYYIDVASDKKMHDTQPLNDDIFIDLDEEGNIVGIEIWQASKNIVEPIAGKGGKSEGILEMTAK